MMGVTSPLPRHLARTSLRLERLWAWIEPAIVWAPTAILVLPLLLLLYGSFSVTWDSRGISGFTLQAYVEIWPVARDSLTFSFFLATAVAAINTVLAVPFAVALAQDRTRGAAIVKVVVAMPMVLPPMIVAMGLILAYPALIGSWQVLLVAHVVWTFPMAVWPIMTAMMALDSGSLTAAARTLGASERQSFFWVLLPNLKSAVLLSATMTFVLSFAEINGSLFLASASNMPVGVGLLESFLNNEIRLAAAYTVLFVLCLTPVLAVHVQRTRA